MKRLFMTLGMVATLGACTSPSGQDNATDNPLFSKSPLDFEAPQFDKIRAEHFLPAFEEGMKQHLAQIDSIASNPEAPTFANTIVAMEQAGELLARASNTFFPIASAHGTDEMRKIEGEIRPRLSAHYDAINLNEKLFARIKTVYEKERAQLEGEDARLLDIIYEGFVREGADLPEEAKEQLKKINEELAVLTNEFGNLVKDGTAAASILVGDVDSLAGLSATTLAQAKQNASDAGKEGYLLTLQNTTRPSYLSELDNRDMRRRVLEASLGRGEQGNEYDTRDIVKSIVRLRAEKARLLGEANFSAWKLQDQMAGKPEHVQSFISRIAEAYRPKAEADAKELEAFARQSQGADFTLEAWDWDYYAEKLRKAKYDLDENDIKPYFALDSVVQNGLFFMAKELYGITFKPRPDLPVYADHVYAYEVLDKDGSSLAIFYTDYYKRSTKSGGAWMGSFVRQTHLLGTRPVVYNVCNYAPPVDGKPALLNMDEVTTLFHEFGHGLHGIFADSKYSRLSGTSVSRDFVEMPSQLHEHWATDPAVLGNYARHYETGEAMPASLVEKMKAAAQFNQAYALGEALASVVIDFAWHTQTADAEIADIASFERKALDQYGLLNSKIPPRYRSTYFRHSMGGGYASGYYAYLWAEVLDNNVYDWFIANGGLKAENGQRLRDIVLSQGNTKDLNGVFQEMTGLKEPNIQSLMRARGL